MKTKTTLEQANQLFRQKQYDEALQLYALAIEERPEIRRFIKFNVALVSKRLHTTCDGNGLPFNYEENKSESDSLMKKAIQHDLWNEEFYLNNNQDVKDTGVDPFDHYITHGWREGRVPSRGFDVSFYIEQAGGFLDTSPIEHFIAIGKNSGLKTNNLLDANRFRGYFLKEERGFTISTERPVDILVPVYNGYEYLTPLFESVYQNTTTSFRLLVANDCSKDERVLPLLELWAVNHKNFILIKNDENVGFVGTINKLARLADNHFVILNTDTEVPYGWLERLMYPIFEFEKVATTTPFTNAGTICSFPDYLKDNPLPDGLSVNEVDEYFRKVSLNANIEIPTGVGFCMGVNKHVVEKIGMFNVVFGKGYGEENDFCQRAISIGYKNIHVANLFVYHKHGGSFLSEEKQSLIDRNLKILNRMHPTYARDVNNTILQDLLMPIRAILNLKIKAMNKKVVLFFDHGLGGGTTDYLNDQVKKLKKQNMQVAVVSQRFGICFTLTLYGGGNVDVIEFSALDGVIELLAENININEIFINSLVGYPDVNNVIDSIIRHKGDKKLTILLHDYYMVCPSYTLLNNEGVYCGVPDDLSICQKCITTNNREFKRFTMSEDIGEWRFSWHRILRASDKIIAFSQSSIDIFSRAYSQYQHKIDLIPHDISSRFKCIHTQDEKIDGELVIGVLGGINETKGLHILIDLAEHIENSKINARIVVFGETSEKVESHVFECTGRYTHDELPAMIKNKSVSLFFIPSIWPETYCFTVDEVMQLGYPLAVFNIGAQADRVSKYNKGIVLDIGMRSFQIMNYLKSRSNNPRLSTKLYI